MINWEIEKKEKEKRRKLMTAVGAIEASRICPRDADHTVGVMVSRVKIYRLADSAACMTPQMSHRSTDSYYSVAAASQAQGGLGKTTASVHVARGIGKLTERIEFTMKPPFLYSRFLLKLQLQAVL